MNGRFTAPGATLFAVIAAALLAVAGCGSGGTPSGTSSTHSTVRTYNPGSTPSTDPASNTSQADSFLGISPNCLVSMSQVSALSTTIANMASKPIDQPATSSGPDTCQYGGKTTSTDLVVKALTISVKPTWSGTPSHFAAQRGFTNVSTSKFSTSSLSVVTVGAQITSGAKSGSWLVLSVGNNGPPLVTTKALVKTLTAAEKQYAASNGNPSPAPSASTGRNGSGRFPCNLLSVSMFNSFGPNGMTGNVSGSGAAPNFDASTTVQTCGFVFYVGPNDSGAEKGYVTLTLSCGPSAKLATDADDMQRVFSMPNGTTAAVALTFGIGLRHYVNTPLALEALSAATSAAKTGGRCT